MRRTLALVVSAILGALPTRALATDYHVAIGGSDTAAGTSLTTAWASIGKCAKAVGPGDRCLVHEGEYHESGIELVQGGELLSSAALSGCRCVRGSTSMKCASVSDVAVGDFVRCASGRGFSWTEIAAVSGGEITLAEGYRGDGSSSPENGSAARFAQLIGIGQVRVNEYVARPAGVTWEKVAGFDCVYRYAKSAAGAGDWGAPTGFREEVGDASWDTAIGLKNGRDIYYRVYEVGGGPGGVGGDCPCKLDSISAQVDSLPRSWGDDGSHVYLQMSSCEDPNQAPLVAGSHAGVEPGFTLKAHADFSIVENFTLAVAGWDYARASSFQYGFDLGASNARYARLAQEGGRFHFAAPSGSVDTRYEHIRSLGGSKCGLTQGHSGLALYDVELRGGSPNGFSCDALAGVAEDDRVIIDRLHLHRTFIGLTGAACDNLVTWDCAAKQPAGCPNCLDGDVKWQTTHGLYVGSVATPSPKIDHVMIRNSVIENASDGFGVFIGDGARDVWFVNNTLGAHHQHSALKVIVGSNPSTGEWTAHVYNNLFVPGDAQEGSIWYYGPRGSVKSDHNLFDYYASKGGMRIWREGETFDKVLGEYGQEKSSLLVCHSDCQSALGTVFNDGGEHGLVDAVLSDGSPTNYMPKANVYRGIAAAKAEFCPSEDFLGHPRKSPCDIGAIELYSGPGGVGGSSGHGSAGTGGAGADDAGEGAACGCRVPGGSPSNRLAISALILAWAFVVARSGLRFGFG